MTEPTLSILLFADTEKDLGYLRHYFGGMKHWNADGLDDTQIILVSQHEDSSAVRAIAAEQSFPVEVVEAQHPRVNGYPVWDVFEEIRQAWPLVRGRYVTTNHTEFLWCAGRLRRTIDWLKSERLYMALGNLRRPIRPNVDKIWSKEGCEQLHKLIAAGEWNAAAALAETVPTNHWIYWIKEPQSGPTKWHEDIFFADREWLEAWRMPHHGGRMPFQDVYDVMDRATHWLERFNLMPKLIRMPFEVNRTIHLWHEKAWGSFTPAMRDYFLASPEWRNTTLGDKNLWKALLASRAASAGNAAGPPVSKLRVGQGGTVTRYGASMEAWLNNGGRPALTGFYLAHGKERRER